jgi:hypothetical protein
MNSPSPALRRHASLWVAARVLLGIAVALFGCSNTLKQLPEARRVTSDLRVQFNKGADASVRAVMADTDEASVAFAGEAQQAKLDIPRHADELRVLLHSLGYAEESRSLEEFRQHFAEYQALDKTILELAVENTNLKAQSIAFGPVREVADAFRTSIDRIVRAAPPQTRCRIESLAMGAELAVREIQILHAPHIAESKDDAMNAMEKQMDAAFGTARGALNSLSDASAPASRADVAAATSSLDRLRSLHDQLVALSRKNTNVRSLALALGPGRALAAACDATLSAIEDGLAKRGVKATR